MSNNKFLKGAAVLGIAGVIVKIIGAVFRIPLTNWIGQDGMSYYGCAYPIYSLFLTVSTAGIPVAISKMVSERITVRNYGGAHKVFKVSRTSRRIGSRLIFNLLSGRGFYCRNCTE